MSATMQAQQWDDRALKMDVQMCTCMSWGLHGGQWRKRAADNGVDRGRKTQQPTIDEIGEGEQRLAMRV